MALMTREVEDRIVELLVSEGLADSNIVFGLQQESLAESKSVLEELVKRKIITHDMVSRATAAIIGVPYVELKNITMDQDILSMIPSEASTRVLAVPLGEKDGVLNVFAHFWMPSQRIDEATERDGVPYWSYVKRGFLSLCGDNYVDYHAVYKWFEELVRDHELYPLVVGYDRYSSQYLVNDLEGAGFKMDDVFQGDNLWGVLQELEGLIKDKRIYIGDNDLLKMHLLNSAIKMSTERGRGRLIKINPTSRIDGTAALTDAICVRQKWYGEIGNQLMNE